jgi:hypothetical protein
MNNPPLHRIFLLYCFILCSLCLCGETAFAADWTFTPSATLSQSYDSNFRFLITPAPGTTKDDFITSFNPVLTVVGETEQNRFQLDTINSAQSYVKNPSFDTVNTNTIATLSDSWCPTFSTSETFTFMHDYTLENQLEASGIVTKMTERFAYNTGFSAKYNVTESFDLIASANYGVITYPSNVLPGSETAQGSISPVWTLTPADSIGLQSTFSSTDYGEQVGINSTSIRSISESIFWQRAMSDTLNFKLAGGYYYSMIDEQIPAIVKVLKPPPPHDILGDLQISSAPGGSTFSADITKNWTERLSTIFSAGKQQYNDASGNSYDSMYFGGITTYKLSELTTFNFIARYNTNSELSKGGSKIDYYIIMPSIERSLSENLLVRLSGSYEFEMENVGTVNSSENLDRYRIWVDLTYKWPRFLANH